MVPPGCRLPYPVPRYAALCRALERNLLVFLAFGFSCQRGGRRFEPGLVLHPTQPRQVFLLGGLLCFGAPQSPR